MHSVIFENSIEKMIPACWDDLSTDDLFGLFLALQERKPAHRIKTMMLIRCTGIQVSHSRRSYPVGILPGVKGEISMEQISQLSDCFDFLFSDPDENGNCELQPSLTKNPLRELLPGMDPGTALGGITYGQYQYLCYYMSNLTDSAETSLEAIVNILYQTAYMEGVSIPVSELLSPVLGKKAGNREQCILFIKTVVAWYAAGSMRVLAERFPIVFSGNGVSDGSGNVFEEQLRLLDLLSESDVTKREAVRNANLWDVIHNLSMRIEKSEKQKQERS